MKRKYSSTSIENALKHLRPKKYRVNINKKYKMWTMCDQR